MDVTATPIPGGTCLEAVDGDVVAQAIVMHVPDTDAGQLTYRVDRFWLAPDRRGDDTFAGQLYPALIAKALELGWADDDDVAAYEWTDAGIRVGRVLIHLPDADAQHAALRFRLEARAVAETAGANADLSDEAAAVVELADAGFTGADFPREPDVTRKPDDPGRPRPLGG